MIPFTTSPAQMVRIYQIASQMKTEGLSDEFIAGIVQMAQSYEGTCDLMELWMSEEDHAQRDEIIADLQEEVEGWEEAPKKPSKKPYIKFDDLEAIAQDISGFKHHLRSLVDQWGGISRLARESGIPQPSLSRFFSSENMPRRTTLYKIANTMGLSEKEIISDWAA